MGGPKHRSDSHTSPHLAAHLHPVPPRESLKRNQPQTLNPNLKRLRSFCRHPAETWQLRAMRVAHKSSEAAVLMINSTPKHSNLSGSGDTGLGPVLCETSNASLPRPWQLHGIFAHEHQEHAVGGWRDARSPFAPALSGMIVGRKAGGSLRPPLRLGDVSSRPRPSERQDWCQTDHQLQQSKRREQ